MADPPSSPATLGPSSRQPTTDSVNNPTPKPDQHPSSATAPAPPPLKVNPNPNPVVPVLSPAPPTMTSFAPPISGASPAFRPAPQFSPLPNFQNPSVPPPGVSSAPVMAPVSVPPQVIQYPLAPGQLHNPALRPFTPIPNGYAAVPGAGPPGLPRYPSPYPTIARPAFPPRPPGAIGVLPRPLVPGIQGVRPVVPPVIRPAAVPSVTPAEKPQTTVYIGKIAPTVDNDFMLSLLRLCGPVKSWKRQDLTDGTPRGFGFCEFESAEGVLHALRLLSKLVIDGQELVLNVNQATRAYLEQYVEKKKENAKQVKDREVAGSEKESESSAVDGKNELVSADDPSKQSDSGDKENPDPTIFGIVTEEDQQADREASWKIANMIEERLKAKPLPPPPPMSGAPDSSTKPYAELASRSRDGDSDVDAKRNDGTEVRKDDETISNSRAASVHGRSDTSSPDRRHDRRSRDRDRDQDLKREKEREIERLERETERERIRKEREQRRKIEEAEREYERYLRDWEQREKEKEKQRQYEKEKEKERERKRKKEILYDEEEDEDDDSRKRWRRSALEEKRRKRLREKEEDLADRVKEEEEITEAKKQAEEEKSQRQQYEALRFLAARAINGGERTIIAEESIEKNNDNAGQQEQTVDSSHDNQMLGVATFQNGSAHESNMAVSEGHQISAAPTKKLGFGLLGSGKRTTVPSVFNEEEDAQKEKKMRPLVPIDYSTEELQAVQPSVSGATPPNLVAAAEFAKRISIVGHKEEKIDIERERSRRSSDKSTRDRDRNDDDNSRTREESKEKNMDRDRDRSHGADNSKTTDNQKFLDAKQLIDMIPKTKEELFSYEINWDVYDEHELHERMRPWISKKITEFLGEEEKTLVDYIVSSTQEHVKASRMLEQLQTILDEEAEMFVLKMWRMLIFEIKKVETGLALRPKS